MHRNTHNLSLTNNEMTKTCQHKFEVKTCLLFSLSFVGRRQSNFKGFVLLADHTPDRPHSPLKFPNKLADPSLNGFFTLTSFFGFGAGMAFP